jgi:hypothetical protein
MVLFFWNRAYVASAPNAKLDTQGKFTGSAHARRGNGFRGGKPDAFMRPRCNDG